MMRVLASNTRHAGDETSRLPTARAPWWLVAFELPVDTAVPASLTGAAHAAAAR